MLKAAKWGAALLLSGCASQIMQGYVGRPMSAAVEDYGMPAGGFETAPGQRAFIWHINSVYSVPGQTSTSATIVGNSVFSNSYTAPPSVISDTCTYVLYATQTRTDIEGPAAWTVTGYKKPKFGCE